MGMEIELRRLGGVGNGGFRDGVVMETSGSTRIGHMIW